MDINQTTLERIKKHLGEKIKYLRNSNEIKQSILAKQLKISRASLSDYENGKKLPTLEILLKLCIYFQVGCDELIGTNGILYENDYNKNQFDLVDVSSLSHRDTVLIQKIIDIMNTTNI